MSTNLFDEGQLYVQQFGGGKERGLCLQIGTGTPDGGAYIQINAEELAKLLPVLTKWFSEAYIERCKKVEEFKGWADRVVKMVDEVDKHGGLAYAGIRKALEE
jgi:hypothetical protein